MGSAIELLEFQRSRSRWQLNWMEVWANESEREQVAVMAQEWCDRLPFLNFPTRMFLMLVFSAIVIHPAKCDRHHKLIPKRDRIHSHPLKRDRFSYIA